MAIIKNFHKANFYLDAGIRNNFPALYIVAQEEQVYAEDLAEVKTMEDVQAFMKKWRKDFTDSGFFEYVNGNYRPYKGLTYKS